MTTERTKDLVRAYYEGWKGGTERFDEQKLRAVLVPNVAFESPLSRRDDASGLVEGIARFAKTIKAIHFHQTIVTGNEAAVVYDCELTAPVPTLRCAEFFRVEGDRIAAIRLVFDASGYRQPAKA
jgi:hypothetical protein